jgi:hypothetical protein
LTRSPGCTEGSNLESSARSGHHATQRIVRDRLDGDPSRAYLAGIRSRVFVVATLVGGLVFFLAIVLYLNAQPRGPARGQQAIGAEPAPLLSYLAIAFAVASVPASILVPQLMAASQRRSIAKGAWTPPPQRSGTAPTLNPTSDAGKLASVYITTLIIGAAMNEGAGFFANMAYLLERQQWVLIVAVLLIVGVALRFPTRDRIDRWIEAQLEQLEMDRQRGD